MRPAPIQPRSLLGPSPQALETLNSAYASKEAPPPVDVVTSTKQLIRDKLRKNMTNVIHIFREWDEDGAANHLPDYSLLDYQTTHY